MDPRNQEEIAWKSKPGPETDSGKQNNSKALDLTGKFTSPLLEWPEAAKRSPATYYITQRRCCDQSKKGK